MVEKIDEQNPAGDDESPLNGTDEAGETFLLAKDLINSFVKTVKAFRLYPAENPTLIEFQEQLTRKFQLFLKQYSYFGIKIGEYDLSFEDKVLYENRDLKTSLAFLLYKDGLRELRFMQGLEEWELKELVHILSLSDLINHMEDDLVTLMWEKDFVHINYSATDAFLEDMPVAIPENVSQFREKVQLDPPPPSLALDDLNMEEGDLDYEGILYGKTDTPSPVLADRNVYLLSPRELEALRKEVEAELAPSSVFNVIDIVFELLALEKNRATFEDAANLLQKLLDALLTMGDFKKAADLLSRMHIILKTYEMKDWQTQVLQRIIDGAGDARRIEGIGKILEKGVGVRLEEAGHYLLLVKPSSIPPLIKILGELSNSKARRMICDVMCEIGKNHLELIWPAMDDKRWFLVRNVVYILGRIGKEQSLPAIQKTLGHPEPRVRREAVQALGLIGGSKAFLMLGKALGDEDVAIRYIAVLNYAKVGKEDSLPLLLETVQGKDFAKKEPAEIKAFLDAIGLIGSDMAVGILQKLLEQRSWFGGGKREEIRFGAANALALIGTSKAKMVLDSGRKSRDEILRRACEQASRRLTS